MLCAAYPTYPVSEDTSQLYLEVILDRDAADAIVAVRNWIMREPHFPRVSELLAAIRAEARRHPEPIAALTEPTRPKLSLDEVRAMRPKGLTHGRHHTPRGRREEPST